MPHFDRQPPRMLVRRFALARDRQVGRGVFEHRTRVRVELAREQHDEQPDQAVAGAQRHEGDPGPVVRGAGGGQAELGAHRLGGGAGVVSHLRGVADELPHDVARQRVRRRASHGGRGPFVGVVARLVQRECRRPGGRREHFQGRAEPSPATPGGPASPGSTTPGAARRRVQGGEQARDMLLHLLAPGERGRHLVHTARDHPELFGLTLVQPRRGAARRHALQRRHDSRERRREAAAVVRQPDREGEEHDRHDQRRLHR